MRWFFSCTGSFWCSCVFFLVDFSWRPAGHPHLLGQSSTQSQCGITFRNDPYLKRNNIGGHPPHLERYNCFVVRFNQRGVIPYIWIIALSKKENTDELRAIVYNNFPIKCIQMSVGSSEDWFQPISQFMRFTVYPSVKPFTSTSFHWLL